MEPNEETSLVRRWLEDNERSVAWLARQTGWTRVHIGNVLNNKVPMSQKLARDLNAITGLKLRGEEHGNTKVEDQESDLLAAAAL